MRKDKNLYCEKAGRLGSVKALFDDTVKQN